MSAPPPGETDLPTLLSTMTFTLSPTTYVYLTTTSPTPALLSKLDPILTFREAEGTTLITTLDLATTHGHEHTYACRMITLEIHSSLAAVGFMAAIAKGLGERGCSANVVSGYFHDHVFVPEGMEGVAMEVLGGLREGAKGV
ncbi:hypothetical protein VE01_08574 [Pseudogymnoascus verrucosus]|uniref:DUF2241 domain-containing protein n=1 Tax=Pseudogymnoascus verrucosus TaxID=342668 RepID=A0A1B8GB19_9PEZI|nr:uncharacterized protein VE01_08574 [Pseudogymnoascus verrucosus]OBT93020.1 hypothetical protein VE01_08574 [Pseudogymnoascus verrucosus]